MLGRRLLIGRLGFAARVLLAGGFGAAGLLGAARFLSSILGCGFLAGALGRRFLGITLGITFRVALAGGGFLAARIRRRLRIRKRLPR